MGGSVRGDGANLPPEVHSSARTRYRGGTAGRDGCEDYVDTIGRRQITAPVGFEERGVIDIVEDEECASAGFKPGPHHAELRVEAFALVLGNRNTKLGRQIDERDPQVGGSGGVQEKSATRIVGRVLMGIFEGQRTLAHAGQALESDDGTDVPQSDQLPKAPQLFGAPGELGIVRWDVGW